MLLLASGCLCCTIRGDLVAALENLLRRRNNDRIAPFARLLIETTGLADPAPILQTLLGHPYFALRFSVSQIITVVDAVHGAATLDRHREAVRQVAVADRLVISKTDMTESDLPTLVERLADLNTRAPRLCRADGEATAARVLDGAEAHAALLPDEPHHEHHGSSPWSRP